MSYLLDSSLPTAKSAAIKNRGRKGSQRKNSHIKYPTLTGIFQSSHKSMHLSA